MINLSRATRCLSSVRRRLPAFRVQALSSHIGIVGAGAVGASCASSIIHFTSAATKVSLYDVRKNIALGEVMDLEDEGYFTATQVLHAEELHQLRECDIIVITAGAKQKPNESRAALMTKNACILKEIIDALMPVKPSAILLVVTNPVDVLTSLVQTWTEGQLPKVIYV